METRKPIRGGWRKNGQDVRTLGSEESSIYVGETAASRKSRNGTAREVIGNKECML